MNWKEYEQEIFDHLKEQYPSAQITQNAKIMGKYSRVERQIDILIEEFAADFKIRIVVDSKYHDTKIDVKEVEAFLGMLKDVEAHKGLLVSYKGHTKAAVNRAFNDDSDLELDVLNFDELKQFQGFGAIPYSGSHGVLLSAPFGWVVDGTRREGFIACLYQRGLTLEEAGRSKEWMYINIWSKKDEIADLDSLLKYQEGNLKNGYPGVEITYRETVRREDARTKLRIANVPGYPTPEYTGFVEFEDFILFCVLFTEKELEKKNIRKLEYILRKVLPIGIRQNEGIEKPETD